MYRFNGVRISDFHYQYNEASMETRSKEEKSALFAYGISLTSIFVFHISASPCDGMTCQNNGTCLVNMADGTAQRCCTSGFTGANCENAGKNLVMCKYIGKIELNTGKPL